MFFALQFFLQFSASLRIIVDKTNFQSLVDISHSLPVFIVFYSPYCIHCQKMHPDWIEFMEKYKNDPLIVAAEINCVQFRKEASTLMSVSGYPTYAVINDGRGTPVSVARTTKDFCAKAEELKSKYPPKAQIKVECNIFKHDNDDVKYPFMTLLASYNPTQAVIKDNVILGLEDACKILEKISGNTKIDLNNFLINQTSIVVKPSEYLLQSNSIIIAKAFVNPTKSIEYKITISTNQVNTNNETKINNTTMNNSQFILSDNLISYNNTDYIINESLYNIDSLSLFANEYLKYTQFGNWDLFNDQNAENFAFRTSKRRLLLFVIRSIEKNSLQDDDTLSNQVIMKYKPISANNAEHFLVNKVSSKQLYDKWNIELTHQPTIESSSVIDLIISNQNKTHFSLIKNVESLNIQEVFTNISSGLYDDQHDVELENLNKMYGNANNRLMKREFGKRPKNSGLLFFSLGYLFFTVIITITIIIFLMSASSSSVSDSKNLIEHDENDLETNLNENYSHTLTIESDDNDDAEAPVKSA